MKYIILLTFILLLNSCTERDMSDVRIEKHSELPKERKKLTDTVKIKKEETQKTNLLDLYFENPLDFNEYKFHERELLNCGKAGPPLFKPDTQGFYYGYCLFNFGKKKSKLYDNKEVVLAFSTWKKSLKGKDGYYNARNEKLIGIQCAIQDKRLAQSDWVKKDSLFIVEKLGLPQKIRAQQFCYFKDNKILILNFNQNKKVNWYKFFHLAKPVQDNDLTTKEFTEWGTRFVNGKDSHH